MSIENGTGSFTMSRECLVVGVTVLVIPCHRRLKPSCSRINAFLDMFECDYLVPLTTVVSTSLLQCCWHAYVSLSWGERSRLLSF